MVEPAEASGRRGFLRNCGLLTGVLALGGPLAALAPGRVWAVDLKSLSSAEGAALLAMTRTIAPHDRLEDAVYALVVSALDADAGSSAATSTLLRQGIAELGNRFVTDEEGARVRTLQAVEQTEFFRLVRQKTVQVLYSSPLAFAYFGYEGESFSKGGYLARGFNDLRWLPEVPDGEG
jgi:hypothetical protein